MNPSETVRHALRLLDLAARTNYRVTAEVEPLLFRAAVLFEIVEEYGPSSTVTGAVESLERGVSEARSRTQVWDDPVMLDYWLRELAALDLIVEQSRHGLLFIPAHLCSADPLELGIDLGPLDLGPVVLSQCPLVIRYATRHATV
jgi:hypothetical protein